MPTFVLVCNKSQIQDTDGKGKMTICTFCTAKFLIRERRVQEEEECGSPQSLKATHTYRKKSRNLLKIKFIKLEMVTGEVKKELL